jgi:glycosyltransferase involved in cell wall biosynthesis
MEAHVLRLGRALTAMGIEVLLITAGTGVDVGVADEGFDVRQVPLPFQNLPGVYNDRDRPFSPPWKSRRFVETIEEAIAEFRPHVVHGHGWASVSAGAAAGESVPWVVTLHDYGTLCPMKTLLRDGDECSHVGGLACIHCPGSNQGMIRRTGLGVALAGNRRRPPPSAYVAVSVAVRDIHVSAGIRPIPEVVSNFTDVVDSEPSRAPEDGPLLFVGSDAPNKGLAVLLDAWGGGAEDRKRTLRVVGAVQKQVEVPGVHYTGQLSGDELWNEFRRAAIVLIPSTWQEPCPTVALEAMAFGRPIVGSRTGGIPSLVEEGVTGKLVPSGDARALRGAWESLLSSPGMVQSMGEAARKRSDLFATASLVPKLVDLYVRLIDRSS